MTSWTKSQTASFAALGSGTAGSNPYHNTWLERNKERPPWIPATALNEQIMQMSSYTATNPTARSAGSTQIKELVPCLQRTVPFPLRGLTSLCRNPKYWVTTS